jgi:predicted Zn finger-like uncharacterized protein
MEVTCESCGSEYEFDDALVSERGTTVQCTACGQQFRVRRAGDGNDVWTVRTLAGAVYEFRWLRDLQAAIAGGTVTRDDVLTRGGRPRRLGHIAELEPFFPPFEPPPPVKTLPPPALPARAASGAPPAVAQAPSRPPPHASDEAPTAVRAPARTPSGGARPSSSPATGRTLDMTGELDDDHAVTQERARLPAELIAAARQPAHGPTQSSPPEPARQSSPPSDRFSTPTPSPPPFDSRISTLEEPFGRGASSSLFPKKRGGSARWVVGTILAGAALFGGVVVARRQLAAPPPVAATDPRVLEHLAAAAEALKRGDLEGAKDRLVMANGLDAKNPTVALELARLAVARADVSWLRSKLLPPDHPELDTAKAELGAAAGRAKAACAALDELQAADPSVPALRVDSLRLSSDLVAARAQAEKLPAGEASAVAKAAVELASDTPANLASAVAALTAAAEAEGAVGRARSLLAYALVRSGQHEAAKAEAKKLASLPAPHPLAKLLEAFANQASTDALPTDPKVALKEAQAALDKGDLDRAEKLFDAVLKKKPSDAAALAGKKKVAEKRADAGGTAKADEKPKAGGAKPLAAQSPGVRTDGSVPDDYVYVPPGETKPPPAPEPAAPPAPAPAPAPTSPP